MQIKFPPSHIFSWIGIIAIAGWMQAHGIAYWQIHAGVWIGTIGSLIVEYAALYNWYHRNNFLGLITSLVLLSGPLADMYFDEQAKFKDSTATELLIAIDVADLNSSRKVVENLSGTTWAGTYIQAAKENKKTKEELKSNIKKGTEKLDRWQHDTIVGQYALLIIALLLTQVKMMIYVRPKLSKKPSWFSRLFPREKTPMENIGKDDIDISKAMESTGKSMPESGNIFESFPNPAEVFGKLTVYKMQLGESWVSVGKALNIDSKEFSRLQNRAGNIEGKEHISDNKLKMIYEALKAKGAW